MFAPPDSLLFDCFFAISFMASLPLIGIAALQAFAKQFEFKPLEMFTYGTAVGILIYAAVGLLVVCIPSHRQAVSIALIFGLNAIATVYWLKARMLEQFKRESMSDIATAGSAWLALALLCIFVSHATIKFPAELFDGPYVIKNHNLHVKIQTITGHLPADNYIPYVVEEFFLRDISFKAERPIMPGQEVSNRPILMALVAIPFRAALAPPPRQSEPLPKFQYVGTSWPNVGVLGEDRYFRQFLVVGIALNALVVLGAALLFNSLGLSRSFFVAGLLLLVINPYYISQVIFTWPKAMAGFYILLAIHALAIRNCSATTGFFAALAYLSHPYAMVFAGSLGLYLALQIKQKTMPFHRLLEYGGVFSAMVAPWFIWTKLILHMSSDLIAQNLFNGASLIDALWVRIPNLYLLVTPRFLELFPFNGDQLLQTSLICIPGVVGILFFAQAYAGCKQYFSEYRVVILYGIVIPGLLLVMIFSTPSVPALHGFQAIFPILILLSLKWLQNRIGNKTLVFMTMAQLSMNIGLLLTRAATLGVFGA